LSAVVSLLAVIAIGVEGKEYGATIFAEGVS
jgi:hypothetical protein